MMNRTNLKPTENQVDRTCLGHIPPPPPASLNRLEEAEEQEEVFWSNLLFSKVRLGSTNLPEARTPTRKARTAFCDQIRIKMDTLCC